MKNYSIHRNRMTRLVLKMLNGINFIFNFNSYNNIMLSCV